MVSLKSSLWKWPTNTIFKNADPGPFYQYLFILSTEHLHFDYLNIFTCASAVIGYPLSRYIYIYINTIRISRGKIRKRAYLKKSHPKSDIHYLKKVLLKERLHPWHLLSYYGHFTSFCCLSRWQRCFIFIPSLRSEPTGVNKAAQWVEGVFITQCLSYEWLQIKPYRDGEDGLGHVLVTFFFGRKSRQLTKTEEKRNN